MGDEGSTPENSSQLCFILANNSYSLAEQFARSVGIRIPCNKENYINSLIYFFYELPHLLWIHPKAAYRYNNDLKISFGAEDP